MPIDHVRVLAHWMRDTPLNPSNLRAPGKPANVFAVEGCVDEAAAAVGADALAFRPRRLTDARALDVLSRAAAAFKWRRVRRRIRRGARVLLSAAGLAYMRYKQAKTTSRSSWTSP